MRRQPFHPVAKVKPHRINDMIHAKEIRVIDDEKKQLGVMTPADALALARQRGLDLVEIAPAAVPPVCRVMDYGKFLYELHKKDHEARKHQKQIHVKEIKFRPKISIHDFNFKMKHVLRFLDEGDKVKITIMLRGRERSRPELGFQVLQRVLESTKACGRQDGETRKQDWAVSALLVPVKTGGRDAKAKIAPGSPQEVSGHGQEKSDAQ